MKVHEVLEAFWRKEVDTHKVMRAIAAHDDWLVPLVHVPMLPLDDTTTSIVLCTAPDTFAALSSIIEARGEGPLLRGDLLFLAHMLDDVNKRLEDPHSSVGPSHFMLKDMSGLTEKQAQTIWRHSILPALSDRFFDDPKQLEQFSYAQVRKRAADTLAQDPNAKADEDDDDADAPPAG